MEKVIEALPARLNVSTSNYYNEWLGFLEEYIIPLNLITDYKRINFTDELIRILEMSTGIQIMDIDETSKSEIYSSEQNIIINHEIPSPLMPPNKSINIKVIVKNIEKGIPSICDEIMEL